MPTDPVDAILFTAILVGVIGLPALGLMALLERLTGPPTPPKPGPRIGKRIDEEERQLLGDDWRESVNHLFPTTHKRQETR